MIKVTVGDKVYEHDRTTLLISDAIQIKRLTGMTIREWQQGLIDDDPDSLKGLVWLLKSKAGENPDWDELDFDFATLEFGPEDTAEVDGPKEDAPVT